MKIYANQDFGSATKVINALTSVVATMATSNTDRDTPRPSQT
jgi:hypothetical protein